MEGWGDIKKKPISPVRRGTHRRRARAIGMHMSTFWQANDRDQQIMYQLSRVGRR